MNPTSIVALCGGVGGAKLVQGLANEAGDRSLLVVVNTGDDFEHLGLHISPDIDTVLYTLAGLSDPVRGWGRRDETWNCLDALAALGGETWFRLGDRDLALHLERTRRIGAGEPLSRIVDDLAGRLGIRAKIVPMTDDSVRTVVHTGMGALSFQDYFVRHHCQPAVMSIAFDGAPSARAHPDALRALTDRTLAAIVIAPSNPYLSIDPILSLPAFRQALVTRRAPVVAVSPIVGGTAVKGPAAKIMRELSVPTTCQAIAGHYAGLIDGIVIDESDAHEMPALAIPVLVTRTLMHDLDDKQRLAREVIAFAGRLAAPIPSRETQ